MASGRRVQPKRGVIYLVLIAVVLSLLFVKGIFLPSSEKRGTYAVKDELKLQAGRNYKNNVYPAGKVDTIPDTDLHKSTREKQIDTIRDTIHPYVTKSRDGFRRQSPHVSLQARPRQPQESMQQGASNSQGNGPFGGMVFYDGSGNKVESHDKWIVVTSINGPTKDVLALSKVPGWKVIVVGDTKTPKNWKCPNVVFLDTETQLKMGLQVLQYIPFKSYARKNIGYLFALKHGAKFIYDTDDDNQPNDSLRSFDMGDGSVTSVLLVETKNLTYNPYPHFGQRTIWPRGFPLDLITGDQPREYKLCKMPTPLLRQGVVNGDPDVDAIFRLTKKHPNKRLNILFDRSAPRVVLPVKTIAPYNSQNTISAYDAFWGLLFPVTLNFRVCDIWRSYWAQRLFWMIGHRIGFYTAGTFQFRSPHSYLKDFTDERQMYEQATDFVHFLSEWQCRNTEFFECVKELSYAMVPNRFWNETDAKLVDAWLQDLISLGYKPPRIKENRSTSCLKPPSRVIFYPHEQKATVGESTTYSLPPMYNKFDRLRESVHEVCPRPKQILLGLKLDGFSLVNDILLIIVVRETSIFTSIGRLEAFYRPRFSQILYCGTWREPAINVYHDWQASFAEINNTAEPTLACLLKAAEMHYLVDGYMIIQEEMLVNVDTIKKSRNSTWVMKDWIPDTPQSRCQGSACRNEEIRLDDVTKAVIADGRPDVYSSIYQRCPLNKPGVRFSVRQKAAFYIPAHFNEELRNMADTNTLKAASVFAWLQCLSPQSHIELKTSLTLRDAGSQTDLIEKFDLNKDAEFCPLLGFDA